MVKHEPIKSASLEVNHVNEQFTAAALYQVSADFKRFNQKYNMTRQPLWKTELSYLADCEGEALLNNLGREGFTQLDWGFYVGSNANIAATGFGINEPDLKGNSWSPLQNNKQWPLPQENWKGDEITRGIKKMARLFGADEVGIARLDRRWVYSHWYDEETGQAYPIVFSDEPGFEVYREPQRLGNGTMVIPASMQYAVVMLFDMEYQGITEAPRLTQMATTISAYSLLTATTIMLAEAIRAMGYQAIPSSNCTALNIPLAIDAGLGELGRNAKLITPRFGPRCRIAKVITDLPLNADHPVSFGATKFCESCRECVKHCPAGAIPAGKRSYKPRGEFNNSGVLQWQVHHLKCKEYWSRIGTNCGLCIAHCPYNQPPRTGLYLEKHPRVAQWAAAWRRFSHNDKGRRQDFWHN